MWCVSFRLYWTIRFEQPWISVFITSMIISLCYFHYFRGVIPCSNTTRTDAYVHIGYLFNRNVYIGQKYIKFTYICSDVDFLYSFVFRACVSRKLNNIHISFILHLIISAESIKVEWWTIDMIEIPSASFQILFRRHICRVYS